MSGLEDAARCVPFWEKIHNVFFFVASYKERRATDFLKTYRELLCFPPGEGFLILPKHAP